MCQYIPFILIADPTCSRTSLEIVVDIRGPPTSPLITWVELRDSRCQMDNNASSGVKKSDRDDSFFIFDMYKTSMAVLNLCLSTLSMPISMAVEAVCCYTKAAVRTQERLSV